MVGALVAWQLRFWLEHKVLDAHVPVPGHFETEIKESAFMLLVILGPCLRPYQCPCRILLGPILSGPLGLPFFMTGVLQH